MERAKERNGDEIATETINELSKVRDYDDHEYEFQEMFSKLPREKFWNEHFYCLYQKFWYPSTAVKGTVSFQNHFKARDTDIIITSTPKAGATWMKSLIYAIVHRAQYPDCLKDSPLLTQGPHELVRIFELDLYLNNSAPNLEKAGHPPCGPRIFNTHVSYSSLPASIKDSECRIVYVYRNPADQIISNWYFISNIFSEEEPVPLSDMFEMFCRGVTNNGPFWDHALEFWRASLARPGKVMFFNYGDMKLDIRSQMKRLAEFCGVPFSPEEEEGNVLEDIMKLCSFKNLNDLEANKKGMHVSGVPNEAFFRKGEVGDGHNHLTPPMIERLRNIMDEKFAGSGLSTK